MEEIYVIMYRDIRSSQKRRQVGLIKIEFFIACIIQGLEYVHANNILHRDIKPENLVLDSKGKYRIIQDI
jgi:serine/threonine protein kinase